MKPQQVQAADSPQARPPWDRRRRRFQLSGLTASPATPRLPAPPCPALRQRELIQLAAEQGDLAELRRLSDGGNATATDQLIELATEQDNLDELRRLADRGNATAAEQLAELTAE
ncbi:hypothetical protein PV726_07270 [Streptomyces europaeiscabiei]|uniref:hypothetical protein n=1 Tax=Streptomyces europaeiscabiei TaxID=146819 RepID=UPI0029A9F6EB|nr:hypothetical protein [Streptomyces europaeiscabiei]MDX3690131.1 hypothetical protein [Streptomyces europaeiscabiei]